MCYYKKNSPGRNDDSIIIYYFTAIIIKRKEEWKRQGINLDCGWMFEVLMEVLMLEAARVS